jgi:hypothetical protein
MILRIWRLSASIVFVVYTARRTSGGKAKNGAPAVSVGG